MVKVKSAEKAVRILKKHTLKILIIGVLLFVVIVVSILLSRRNRDVIAIVNGYPITIADILVETELSPKFYKETLVSNPDAVVEDWIKQILLFQQAKKYERQLRKTIQGRMKNHYIKELVSAYVETKLVEKIEIPKEVIAEYYNFHLEDFIIPERVRLFEIVVSSQKAAEDILRRLSMGESFETLAMRESITESREKGGDLGWIDVRKLEPEISSLVTRINTGDILANPIRSEVGYHIIKLGARTQRRMLTLEEATPSIKNMLVFQEKKKMVDSLITEMREKSKITIFSDKIGRLKMAGK